MMSYNLLNFPDPNPYGKADTLADILAWHPVDLLIAEEIHDLSGAEQVLNDALNVNGVGRFSMATFVPQQSAQWATIKLAQCIYYDHNKLGLRDQSLLLTDVRDINMYTMFLRDNGIFQGDTTFFTVYAVHLKASNDPPDIADREAMAQILMAHAATLPAGRPVIVAGDMNVYSGNEPAFTVLLTPFGGVQLEDPLQLGGQAWAGLGNAAIFTQSTRVNTIFGDGAGGGLDDRFDIALLSDDIISGSGPLQLVPGSYRPLGNSGTCWNDNITDCSTWQTPFSILRKLYYMSDHLPLAFSLSTNAVLGLPTVSTHTAPGMHLRGRELVLRNATDGQLTIINALGQLLMETTVGPGRASVELPLDLDGICIARLTSVNGSASLKMYLE